MPFLSQRPLYVTVLLVHAVRVRSPFVEALAVTCLAYRPGQSKMPTVMLVAVEL